MSLISSSTVLAPEEVVFFLNYSRKVLLSSMNDTALVALSVNKVLNLSRPHSIQCSIWFGKFLIVHIGIDSSGGSCESP